jgi:hypothetical protein
MLETKLAELTALRREYLEAWEQSKIERRKTRTTYKKAERDENGDVVLGDDGRPRMVVVGETDTEESPTPAIAYLTAAAATIRQEIELLGLEPPTKVEVAAGPDWNSLLDPGQRPSAPPRLVSVTSNDPVADELAALESLPDVPTAEGGNVPDPQSNGVHKEKDV